MANLTACESARERDGALDLYGVSPDQGPAFNIHVGLDTNELRESDRDGLALMAEGVRTDGGRVAGVRMLFYDWVPGRVRTAAHQVVPVTGVPPGRYELRLVSGTRVLGRLDLGVDHE